MCSARECFWKMNGFETLVIGGQHDQILHETCSRVSCKAALWSSKPLRDRFPLPTRTKKSSSDLLLDNQSCLPEVGGAQSVWPRQRIICPERKREREKRMIISCHDDMQILQLHTDTRSRCKSLQITPLHANCEQMWGAIREVHTHTHTHT